MSTARRDTGPEKSEVTDEYLADVGIAMVQLEAWKERVEGFARELQGQGWIVAISVEPSRDRHGVSIHVMVHP